MILTILTELKSRNMDFKPAIDSFLGELKKAGKIDENFDPILA
jgi:hypothetical protein